MRAGRSFATVIAGAALLLTGATQSNAQPTGERRWSDGNPTFIESYERNGVRVNGIVELQSTTGFTEEPPGFQRHLTGIDRVYQFDQSTLVPLDANRLPDIDLYLITDAFQRRVFVVRPQDGVEVGEFRGPPGTPEALERPVAARAYLENGVRKVVITDQGNHRVMKFDYDTRLLEWTFGTGTPGSSPGQLAAPGDAVAIPDSGMILICDSGNNRILLVDMASRQIRWNWGTGILNNPVDVEWQNGRILITDQGNHRVLIVEQATGRIVWEFGTGQAELSDSTLNAPTDAQFRPGDRILIADGGNARLIEVDLAGSLVWQFLGKLPALRSVYALPDGRLLVITDNRVVRLGYSTETFISEVHDAGRPVNYDSLTWDADLPVGTRVQFQLRSANSLGDLAGARWLGPVDSLTWYETPGSTLNRAHDGHRFFQYRLRISTSNPRETPILHQVRVHYHFFETDRVGTLTSPVIQDTAGMIITSWEDLRFTTVPPPDPATRDDIQLLVQLLDGQTGALLQSFEASTSVPENTFVLRGLTQLVGRQSLRLHARLVTNNSSVSPQLEDWSISWRRTQAQRSSITFTDARGNPVDYIRTLPASQVGDNPPVVVFVRLRDPNLVPVQNSVTVELATSRTGDREQATLALQPTGVYELSPGMPAVIQSFVVPGNGLVEVADRDTLVVRYVDPTTPEDRSIDSLVVLQYTTGTLTVLNPRGEPVTTAAIGDTLWLRITGEKDHDRTAAQDTLWATLFDNVTDDVEPVLLVEMPDSVGSTFTTGDFLAANGIPLRRASTGIDGDGRLQTLPGHQIGARYIDNENLLYTVQIRQDSIAPPPITGPGAFDFLVAPNPFVAAEDGGFRLRICAFTGDLTVESVEIYNLAGDRIRTLPADALALDAGTFIPQGTCSVSSNWWDRRTDNGLMAASGTYWAKFMGTFRSASGTTTRISFMRKFMLVQ